MTTFSPPVEVEETLRHRREEASRRIDEETAKLAQMYQEVLDAGDAQERAIRRYRLLRALRAITKALTDGFAST